MVQYAVLSVTEIIYPDPFMWRILICLSVLPVLAVHDVTFFIQIKDNFLDPFFLDIFIYMYLLLFLYLVSN